MFTARMNYCYEYRTIIRWSRQLQTILVECKQELQKSWYRCSCTHRSLFIAQAAEHWSVTAEWKVCRTNPEASLQTQHSNQLQIHKAMKRSKWTGVVRGHSQESCLYSSCDNQRYRTYHRHRFVCRTRSIVCTLKVMLDGYLVLSARCFGNEQVPICPDLNSAYETTGRGSNCQQQKHDNRLPTHHAEMIEKKCFISLFCLQRASITPNFPDSEKGKE